MEKYNKTTPSLTPILSLNKTIHKPTGISPISTILHPALAHINCVSNLNKRYNIVSREVIF